MKNVQAILDGLRLTAHQEERIRELLEAAQQSTKCHWWEHPEVWRLRSALVELYESWKDLARACGETAFVEAPEDLYKDTKRCADRAQKHTEKILKKTAIKL